MKRKFCIGGFSILAIIVVMSGFTMACTTWLGKMEVQGSGASPGYVVAQGRNFEMQYCFAGTPSGTASMDDNTNGTVTVTMSPSDGDCDSDDLPNGTYDIRWTPGAWSPSNPSVNDCMSTTDVGDISISSGSGGPTSSNSFDPGAAGTIQICVTNSNQTFGMQVPLTVA